MAGGTNSDGTFKDCGRRASTRTTAGRPPSRFGLPLAPARSRDGADVLENGLLAAVSHIGQGASFLSTGRLYSDRKSSSRRPASETMLQDALDCATKLELLRLDEERERLRKEHLQLREERLQLESDRCEHRRALLLSSYARAVSSAAGRYSYLANSEAPSPRSSANRARGNPRATPAASSAVQERTGTLPDQTGTLLLNGGEKPECKKADLVLSKIPEIVTPTSAPRSAVSCAHASPSHTPAPRRIVHRAKASSLPVPTLELSPTSAPEASARGHDRSDTVLATITNTKVLNSFAFENADGEKPLIDTVVNSEDIHRKGLDGADCSSVLKGLDNDDFSADGLNEINCADAAFILGASPTTQVNCQVAPWLTVALPYPATWSAAGIGSADANEAAAVNELSSTLGTFALIEKELNEVVLKLTTIAPLLQDAIFCTIVFAQPNDPPNATSEDSFEEALPVGNAVMQVMRSNRQVASWLNLELCTLNGNNESGPKNQHNSFATFDPTVGSNSCKHHTFLAILILLAISVLVVFDPGKYQMARHLL